jgi:hypothetical protein
MTTARKEEWIGSYEAIGSTNLIQREEAQEAVKVWGYLRQDK